jgi:tripartite-type tricarboxylate transporter receptor subunit TctC
VRFVGGLKMERFPVPIRMPMRHSVYRAAVVLSAILTCAGPVQAQEVGGFYKGKNISIIVGYSVGGGFDSYARILANYLGKYIPGQPRVLVQNMPGAGSGRAASYVYNVGARDGTVLALTRAPVIAPLLGRTTNIGFDATKFTWLGSGASDLSVCALLGNPKIRNMEDTFKFELTLGGLGPGSDEDMYTKILRSTLGMKAKLVSGYPGGAESMLAVERGEIDGRCGWAWSSIKIAKPDWITEKKIKVLTVLAQKRSPELPNVPSVMEFVKDDRSKQIVRYVLNAQVLGRPFVAPPGIPEDRANALRAAFEATMRDEAYLSEMKAKQLDVGPIRWQDIPPLLADFYSTPPEVVEGTRAIISSE